VKRRNGNAAADGLLRERVAEEAARLMIEQGIRDFALAKRKAVERLRLSNHRALPSNEMIEARLAARQRIFEADDHASRVNALRSSAVAVMDVLLEFQPRLVGTVLAGTATLNAVIELHVFSDQPELVAARLSACGWEYRDVERRSRLNRNTLTRIPAYRFNAGIDDVLVEVYPLDGIRQSPLSPVDQKPMHRASRKAVLALLTQ
jgi:hypothetical protein